MAGIAIMQLRDRGLLKLDDPVIQYIPELKMVHNPFGDMSAVTIRHLMTHSAGFRAPTWPWKDRKNKPWHPHEPLHWEQLVAMFPYTEVMFEPGSRFFMSNPGIIFLGRIVEILTTDDWDTYIEKNLFKPLEMHRSYFDTTPYHLMKDKCQSYYLEEGKLEPADPDVNTGITVSNGGLKAPCGDLAKYVDFLMGHPEKQSLYDVILKRSSLEEMWEPQLPIEDLELQHRGQGRMDAIGLTFYLEKNFGMDFVAHRGQQNAFVTHFFLNPDSRTAYIVGYNTVADDAGHNTAIVDIKIKEYLFEHVFPMFH
jgi:CubicO group peptidase (beta-lactamase class C family)